MLKEELHKKALLYSDNPDAYIQGFKDAVKYIDKLLDRHRDIVYMENLLNRLKKEINEGI